MVFSQFPFLFPSHSISRTWNELLDTSLFSTVSQIYFCVFSYWLKWLWDFYCITHPGHLWQLHGSTLGRAIATCLRSNGHPDTSAPLHTHRSTGMKSQGHWDRHWGTALLHPTGTLMSVCLPDPWVLCNIWHFDIEILLTEEKNQKLLHAFSSKERKIKRVSDVRSNELDAQTTEFSMRILYAIWISALLPSTASSQQAPGMCCRQGLTILGSGTTSQAQILGRCSVCGTAFELDLWSEPVLHLNTAICITFDFKPVQPLL